MFFSCAVVVGAASVVVALTLNRHNSALGYWLNALLVVPVDVTLLVVLVRPGHIDALGGASGPAVAAVALGLSTAGLVSGRSSARPSSAS